MLDQLGSLKRTCYCAEVSEEHVGSHVTVMGWVDTRRDLGSLIFLDVRDREGIVQVVLSPSHTGVLEHGKSIRPEFVVAVTGAVVLRSEETVNPSLKTGKVEIKAHDIRVLNRSDTPPFTIGNSSNASEETRLRYRYLDLRRPPMLEKLRLRHRVAHSVREFLDSQGFLDVETPVLTKSTPEGARDYLVPSRLHPNNFYALPQSPQIFKQILMVSGLDRYFQIVRCFRDEDLRSDRQPEFTQVDLEMSFVRKEDIFDLVEGLLKQVFSIVGVAPPDGFPRLTYDEAILRFGTDRPDMRYGLELIDLAAGFTETPFRVFRGILEDGGSIKGIGLTGRADLSRKELDLLQQFVQDAGAHGLAWIKKQTDGWKSSLPKVVPGSELETAFDTAGLGTGDILLIVAGQTDVVNGALASLRSHLAEREGLIHENSFSFLWVHDFPLFTWDDDEERWASVHHPFTSPNDEDIERIAENPGEVRSKAYDVVLNGVEIGGGSIRIHREDVQTQVFDTLKIGREEARSKFGFLLDALRFGAPPHGGIALGLDRIVMLMAGEASIREVIAFPKTARALDLMCGSPSPVSDRQLDELHIVSKAPRD